MPETKVKYISYLFDAVRFGDRKVFFYVVIDFLLDYLILFYLMNSLFSLVDIFPLTCKGVNA